MIVLRSDNRVLVENTEFSYLVDNYASGVGSITIVNPDGFALGDFIVVEEMGKEHAEVFKIGVLNINTGEITLHDSSDVAVNTVHPHAESTKVHHLPYDQVQFWWTASTGTISDEDPAYDVGTPLGTYIDVDPSSWYTIYSDNVNSSGFGWFKYYNSETGDLSPESNPIPYQGFDRNTVSEVFADFDSLMNTRELSLVSLQEKFAWLNEALAMFQNKLNLNNTEYFVSTSQTLSVLADTAEYLLPNDFSDLISITNSDTIYDDKSVPFISVNKVGAYTGTDTAYYLRNRYIGLVPTPTADKTYYYTYKKKSNRVDSLSEYIDLPDNAFYSLKDFMLYRANLKFSNPAMADVYQSSFTGAVNLFIETSVKRDANLDSWEPDPTTIV